MDILMKVEHWVSPNGTSPIVLERWAAGAREMGEVNGFYWDERKKLPKKVYHEKVEQDREQEQQNRKKES
jgi:hypothetical protein